MKKGCILIVLFLSFVKTYSQELLFERPSNLLSLPSNETYNIIQDKQGYIWFSSDAGLCKYNGNKLKVFSKTNGLPEKSCYGIACDSKGIIYVITSKNRVLKIINDSIHEFVFTKPLADSINKGKSFADDFRIIGDSVIVVYTRTNTYKINLLHDNYKNISLSDTNYHYHFDVISNYVIQNRTWPQELRKRESIISLKVQFEKNKPLYIQYYDSIQKDIIKVKSCVDKKGNLYIIKDVKLLKVNRLGKIEYYNLQNPVLSLYIDKNDGIWIGQLKTGISYYKGGVISSENKKYALTNLSVSGIVEDSEGGMWCTTIEKGVFYCQNTYIEKILSPENVIISPGVFKTINNRLFYFAENHLLIENFNNKVIQHNISIDVNFTIENIFVFDNKYYLTTSAGVFITDSLFKKIIPARRDYLPTFAYWAKDIVSVNGKIFSSGVSLISNIKNTSVVEHDCKLDGKTKSIFRHKNDLFAASENGIYKIDQTNFESSLIFPIQELKKATTNKNGDFIILLQTEELIIKSKKQSLRYAFNNIPNLKINDLYLSPEGEIWLASNRGIIKINNSKSNSYVLYDVLYGLPERNYKRFTIFNNRPYISTDEEIYCLNENWNKQPAQKNNFNIKSVFVNDTLLNLAALSNLSYSQNNFKFIVEKLNYRKNLDGNKIFYKIKGFSDSKQYTVDNEIIIAKLNPGNYTLMVYQNENSTDSIINISIVINKPFWLTWWFLTCCIVVFILIIFLVTKKYIYYVREKDRKANEINALLNNYQMAAIRAQMNPHFIFNCINSIQRYILTNDPKTAYGYLTKFSRLIRLVLNYSEENFISLQQEIEIIELYIRLEQLRFENVFEYQIKIENNVELENLFMPPMMLQPYIENAIWHGIMHLDSSIKGILRIAVSTTVNTLVVVVEDNGVGREASKKLEKKTHKSRAISLNEQRIKALNQLNNTLSGSIIIEDVLSEKSEIQGTRVIINIPQENATN